MPLIKQRNTSSQPFRPFNLKGQLPVKEVKVQEYSKPKIHELLPQPPFLLTVVAPRKSGKTNLMVDAMTDKHKYKAKFDDIFIWSQTYHLDAKWKKLNLEDDNVFTEWNGEEARTLLREVEDEVAEHPDRHFLFIFDDMIDANVMNPNKIGVLESIAVRGRHSNVSIIIITQQYMKLSPPIRNNTTNLIVFRIRNKNELAKITNENQENLDVDSFNKIYGYATGTKFCFLHVNNQEPDPRFRFRKNWNELLVLN